MTCDLHTHSVFSDGSYTPTQLIDLSVAMGLRAVALSDHNTVDGLPEFLAAAEGKDIEAIPSVEFSTDYDGMELHVLGLYIPEECFPKITKLLADALIRKEESNIALIQSLANAGYPLDYAAIKAKTPKGKINRAHIAAELTRLGYTTSVNQALVTILAPGAGHYTVPKRPSVWEILDFIRSMGAVPVLAHPFLNLSKEGLEEFLPKAKERSLVGMECYYSLYDKETAEESLRLAERFGLLPSGGSDFHGKTKPNIHMGTGKGDLVVPMEFYHKLHEAHTRM